MHRLRRDDEVGAMFAWTFIQCFAMMTGAFFGGGIKSAFGWQFFVGVVGLLACALMMVRARSDRHKKLGLWRLTAIVLGTSLVASGSWLLPWMGWNVASGGVALGPSLSMLFVLGVYVCWVQFELSNPLREVGWSRGGWGMAGIIAASQLAGVMGDQLLRGLPGSTDPESTYRELGPIGFFSALVVVGVLALICWGLLALYRLWDSAAGTHWPRWAYIAGAVLPAYILLAFLLVTAR